MFRKRPYSRQKAIPSKGKRGRINPQPTAYQRRSIHSATPEHNCIGNRDSEQYKTAIRRQSRSFPAGMIEHTDAAIATNTNATIGATETLAIATVKSIK